MSPVTDHLTSLLARSAAVVEVEPDLARVIDPSDGRAPATPPVERRSGRRVVAAAAVAALATAAGVLVAVGLRSGDEGEGTVDVVHEPQVVDAPEVQLPPRYLLGPDWRVVEVSESTVDTGEMVFMSAAGSIELFWKPADEHQSLVEDRAHDAAPWAMTIAGRPVSVFDEGGENGGIAALWLDGDHSFEIRTHSFREREAFRSTAETLGAVDQAAWLDALPATVVRPADRPAAVDAALAGLPVPEGLDRAGLAAAGTVGEPRHVAYEVTNALVCAWIQQWVDGTEAADVAAVDEAVDAMASSRQWPVLVANDGEWARYIWQVADAMVADVPLEPLPGMPQGTGYQRSVDCPED